MTRLPPLELLDPTVTPDGDVDCMPTARAIVRLCSEHGVDVEVSRWQVGPHVTRYLLEPGRGVAPRKIAGLQEALSVALGVTVRYAGPIGTALGIEVPNATRSIVRLRELIGHGPALVNLGIPVGLDIGGVVVTGSLSRLPHLLVAGATGQGKSVFVNAALVSLLMRCTPGDLKLVLIDPKRVELKPYGALPHLLRPIVTDVAEAAEALRDVAAEMDLRYQRMEQAGVKDLSGWNDTRESQRWPRIVVVVDELADLMMTTGKDVEKSIMRIGQLGRAAGVHLILATQRPSADVVTGLIKANVPSRLAFTVASHVDARVVGVTGAERLIGDGDALWSPVGELAPTRLQTPFVTADEVVRVVAWWVRAAEPARIAADALNRSRQVRLTAASAEATRTAMEGAALREANTLEAQQIIAERNIVVAAPASLEDELKAAIIADARRAGDRVDARLLELERLAVVQGELITNLLTVLEGAR